MLMKFYKNKKNSNLSKPESVTVTNHFNYTMINNFSNISESFAENFSQYIRDLETINLKEKKFINLKNVPTFEEKNLCESFENINSVSHRRNSIDVYSVTETACYVSNPEVPYVDIFSKKIINFKQKLALVKKDSTDLLMTSKTPSFREDINFHPETKKYLRNSTTLTRPEQIQIPTIKKRSKFLSAGKLKNYSNLIRPTLTIPKYDTFIERKSRGLVN